MKVKSYENDEKFITKNKASFYLFFIFLSPIK